MGQVRIVETGEVIQDKAAIQDLLAPHGVEYDFWDTTRLPGFVSENPTLADDQKKQILDTYKIEVDRLIAHKGYNTADIVVLHPETPDLEKLLGVFRTEHYHEEDEVRFVVDGAGVFFIRGKDERVYEVTVNVGDLLIVSEGTYHWFDLTSDHRIKCVRIFQSKEGWKAIFREEVAAGR